MNPSTILINHTLNDGTECVRVKKVTGMTANETQIQQRIHTLAATILRDVNNYSILRVPELHSQNEYTMSRIDMSHPLWLGDEESCSQIPAPFLEAIKEELRDFWDIMYEYKYGLWGFQLYLQPDDYGIYESTVMMVGFEYCGRVLGGMSMPLEMNLSKFFDHPCFPRNFAPRFNHLE